MRWLWNWTVLWTPAGLEACFYSGFVTSVLSTPSRLFYFYDCIITHRETTTDELVLEYASAPTLSVVEGIAEKNNSEIE